jgi:hypothetical protein
MSGPRSFAIDSHFAGADAVISRGACAADEIEDLVVAAGCGGFADFTDDVRCERRAAHELSEKPDQTNGDRAIVRR